MINLSTKQRKTKKGNKSLVHVEKTEVKPSGDLSHARLLARVHRDERYSEFFWGATSRGNSREDKIN